MRIVTRRNGLMPAVAFLLVSCVTSISHAQSTPGLKIGTEAPNFKFKTADGKETDLKTTLKKGDVAIVFYRSASW